jgi:nucleoside-diphosphate-sugar epimerase
MTRSHPDRVSALGARAAVADGLDATAVGRAVAEAEPEVVVHEMTALSALGESFRNPDRDFAETNRLRTEGTDHLLAAARAAGTRRFVAQSYAGWPFARTGGPIKTEEDPLDPDPPAAIRETLAAIRYLEETVTSAAGIEGLVLRYGGFYGPGTSLSADPAAPHSRMVRKRRFPIVGAGTGIWSFAHIDDVASATLAAVEGGAPGIYNVTDDEPAAVRDWLPALATALGAKPPRHLPTWLGRLAGGEVGVVMMNELRGASNAKAKRELGWKPRWSTWREGFVHGLA